MTDHESEAADVLRAIGMHPKYRGYAYMMRILRITRDYPERVYCASGELYPIVANEFGVSIASVERNVRFAIKRTWECGKKVELKRLFQVYDTDYVPTNCEFIAVITECLYHKRFDTMLQLTLAL
ncbi:MAG: sporulation initiation factor Spo0A C-terminal domain-containing protein [Clostridia bacterium]